MSEGLLSFCFTGLGATTSLVVLSLAVGDSCKRIGLATGEQVQSYVVHDCRLADTF